jgi:hypothetical protein
VNGCGLSYSQPAVWILRELVRLLARIAVAVLIAIVIAEIRAVLTGGDTTRTFQLIMLLLGAVYLLLAGTGTGSTASRVVNWGEITPGRGGSIFRGFRPKPEDRQLTPGAVFIGSGIACLAIGLFV